MKQIDGDALKAKFCNHCDERDCKPDATDTAYGCVIADTIDSMPTIEAEPVKHGHWVKGHCGVDEYIKCSVCRARIVNTIVSLEGDAAEDYFDLCPKCGVRMDLKDGDEDNNVRNLTDEETAIYESWIESEAKDTDLNIMGGDGE